MMRTRLIMATVLLAAVSALAQPRPPFRLRFVDYDSLAPLASTHVLFIPRREIAVVEPGDHPNPNLKYAKTLTTGAEGHCQLPWKLAEDLTVEGKVYVDCQIDGYPSFVLRRQKPAEHVVPYYTITLFDRTDGVMYTVPLRTDGHTVLLMQPKEEKHGPPNQANGR